MKKSSMLLAFVVVAGLNLSLCAGDHKQSRDETRMQGSNKKARANKSGKSASGRSNMKKNKADEAE